jgi:pilus assembly protein CpaC
VDSVPGGIVLTGEAKDPGVVEDARRLAMRYVPKDGEVINRIKVLGSNQIQIRVRFAEVARDVDKRFGINWESMGNLGGFVFGVASGVPVIENGANLLNMNRPVTGNSMNGILGVSHVGQKFNINGIIDALAQDGLVTVLAEPNLTAMSGETASFLAGGEFPVPVPQSQTTVSIEWKEYGVSLAFTPTLIGENRINLHVRPEVSQLTDIGSVELNDIVVPALTTRRADTTIELASGQSFAIGGLLNNSQNHSIEKYPFLGDVPILGPLFRSTRFQNNETELVIIITPYIVKPTNEENLALPTDGYSPPTDLDRILNMRHTNGDPDARTISGAPRAVRIEDDTLTLRGNVSDEAPAPSASPVLPVAEQEEGVLMSTPSVENVRGEIERETSKETYKSPVKARPLSISPGGPGGFILE